MLDWRRGLGVSNLLARMNLRLADQVAASENIFLLDPTRWLHAAGKPASPKMWFATKVPYANETFGAAASDILHAVRAVSGTSRRLVVVDLDNTLWGGVVGETGWEGLRLGGHDHIGEAYVGFQNALKALSRKGVQLAIASKNDEAVALEAIDGHPEMVLRRSDFAAWRINWQDKAQNIVELAEELRLGLGSVVFLDDNPAERDRVRTALPEVFVPEWPSDPCKYEKALRTFGEFDVASLSDEDRGRTAMYAKDRERRNVAGLSDTVEAYLERLGTSVVVTPLDKATLPRVAQLFNKTNQLNMATRRLTGEEIAAWAREPSRSLFSLSVSDQFGDLGLTGIVSIEVENQQAEIVDYVLSCRVMGREIEEMMIHLAVEAARDLGASSVTARYEQTKRNAPTLQVLRGSNLTELEEGVFSWDARNPYPKPLSINLRTNAAALQWMSGQ